ncbi:hypothetical protein AB4089_09175 [Arthrobacter sp. 2MCAF15]|uniref:hypothetical protein n=1 Tax=Arthrobacter sp. 2MCAF15 TaxID=3232984 RepID=UPI003F8DC213
MTVSAAWIVAACGVLLAGAGLWAAWPWTAAVPTVPAQGLAPEDAEQPFPRTGAHWLDGYVIFGNTYL